MNKSDGGKLLLRWHEMRRNEELSQVSEELNQYKLKCSRLEKELNFYKSREMSFIDINVKAYRVDMKRLSELGFNFTDFTSKYAITHLFDTIKLQEELQDKLRNDNYRLRNLWVESKKECEKYQEELTLTRKRLECQVYRSLTTKEVKNTFPAHNQLDASRLKYQNSIEQIKLLTLRNKELSEQDKKLTTENLSLKKTIEKTKNLTMAYETLKNELKTKQEKLQTSVYDYNELLRQKVQQENVQQSSMDKMNSIDKKRASKILELEKMLNDYKLQIDNLTKKIKQIQYEHEIYNLNNAQVLKDAQMQIRKLRVLTEKQKAPKNDNKGLKKEYDLIKKQLSNKRTEVSDLRSQIEQLKLDKISLQHDACPHQLGKIMNPREEGKQNKILLKQNMLYRHDIQKLLKLNKNNALSKENKVFQKIKC